MKRKKEILILVIVYIISRIIYTYSGGIFIKKIGFIKENYEKNYHLERKNKAWIEALYRWDAPWYIFIAEKGYRQNQNSPEFKKWKNIPFSAGFLPLFPYFIKFFKSFFSSYEIAGFFLSFLFGLISVLTFYFLISFYLPSSAFYSSLLFLFYPPSIFISLPYAEGLFLTLLFLFFLSYQKNFSEGYLVLPLVLLSKPQGFYTFLLFFFYPKNLKKKIYLFSLWLMGLGLLILIFYNSFGSVLPFFERQSLSRGFPIGPWHGFVEFFLWKEKGIFSWKGSFVDLFLSIFFILLISFSKERRNFPFWAILWAYIVLVFPICSSFLSYQRLILPCFPVFGILGKIFCEKKMIWVVIPILFLIQYYYFFRYSTFQWVS